MSDKKNWGTTVLGWFVVRPEDDAAGAAVATDPAAAIAGDTPDAAPATYAQTPLAGVTLQNAPAAPVGNVDFPGVFAAASIDDEEQARLEKAASLLRSLPAATDPAVKKQIVEASLQAFGVPIDKIIEAGVQEIQALEAYIRSGGADTQKLLAESQQRIAQFQTEIQRIKQVMDERVQEQQAVVQACNGKKLDIQHVLEFFGQEAVARVVRDSPKLIDPSQPAPDTPASS